jgi:hypothetical protein
MNSARLKEILDAIVDPKPGKLTVTEATERLDDFVAKHNIEIPSELLHYLENRSYVKALRFLDGYR